MDRRFLDMEGLSSVDSVDDEVVGSQSTSRETWVQTTTSYFSAPGGSVGIGKNQVPPFCAWLVLEKSQKDSQSTRHEAWPFNRLTPAMYNTTPGFSESARNTARRKVSTQTQALVSELLEIQIEVQREAEHSTS